MMELLFLMKLMKSSLQRIRHQMIWGGDHHLNEILTIRIPLHEIERFRKAILEGILKIMSVQTIRVDVIMEAYWCHGVQKIGIS